jgi:23S rRNA (cytosine1962-C5)-methyltransferase
MHESSHARLLVQYSAAEITGAMDRSTLKLETLVGAAIERRRALLDAFGREGTDCVRLFHGVVEGAPGVTVDRYGPVLLVQTWRAPLAAGDLERIATVVMDALGATLTPCWNHRGEGNLGSPWDERLAAPIGHELGLGYDVRPRHRGQGTLLFLDLRAGRRRVKAEAQGKSVLNLFAYTCSVGVAALAGGARQVVNVDFASSALEIGRANAARAVADPETLRERFVTIEEDVIPVVRQLAGLPMPTRGRRARPFTRRAQQRFDLVVLDPPRWAKGSFGAVDVVRDYPSLFKPALLATAPGGAVLATNHVPVVALAEWIEALERCASKAGRPLASIEVITPEADFPSDDGRHPLKIALARVPA